MKKVLFIGHDANRAGAQIVLLQLLQQLKKHNFNMHLLLEKGGVLEEGFGEVVSITKIPIKAKRLYSKKIDRLLEMVGIIKILKRQHRLKQWKLFREELEAQNIGLIFVNTVAAASVLRIIPFLNVPIVSFVHELEMSVKMYSNPEDLKQLLSKTDHLLAVSKAVANYYQTQFQFPKEKTSVVQVIDTENLLQQIHNGQKLGLCQYLGFPKDAIVVGSCGNAEWRKGNDFFMMLAQNVIRQVKDKPVYFIWIGMSKTSELYDIQRADAVKMGLADRIIHVEHTPNVFQYISQFDIFALCSREDPYPLVVLEAALAQKPIVCFADAGGAAEIVEEDAGFVVPYFDLETMSNRIIELVDDQLLRQRFGQKAKQKVLERHQTESSVQHIIDTITKLM